MYRNLIFIHLILVGLVVLGESKALADDEKIKPTVGTVSEETFQAMIQFFEYDRTIPLEARVVEKKETETTIREKVIFRGIRGFLVPGFLERPKEGDAPFPCVVLMHGWSGSKMNWWEDDNYISGGNARKALLDAGYAIFALDAQTHGDRIAENDYALVNNYTGPGSDERKNYFSLPEIYTQTTVDYRRGLDYLETRPEIDITRLGILGYSMGGTQSVLLTAVESRIKVTVSVVVPAMKGMNFTVDPLNYVRGINGRPILMLMGKQDPLCSVEDAQHLYTLLPSMEKEIVFYDSDHRLTKDYVRDALKWFQKYL